jgi:hypothetical protein
MSMLVMMMTDPQQTHKYELNLQYIDLLMHLMGIHLLLGEGGSARGAIAMTRQQLDSKWRTVTS